VDGVDIVDFMNIWEMRDFPLSHRERVGVRVCRPVERVGVKT